jgi:hypothetical protein
MEKADKIKVEGSNSNGNQKGIDYWDYRSGWILSGRIFAGKRI